MSCLEYNYYDLIFAFDNILVDDALDGNVEILLVPLDVLLLIWRHLLRIFDYPL